MRLIAGLFVAVLCIFWRPIRWLLSLYVLGCVVKFVWFNGGSADSIQTLCAAAAAFTLLVLGANITSSQARKANKRPDSKL